MKFSNGCWLQKEGTECFSPQQVYNAKIEKDCVTLCAPTYQIKHRGDTLGGVNLTIRISSPMPEVIRVQTYHYMGVVSKTPEFELFYDENNNIQTIENDNEIIISSGSLSLVINKQNWSMIYKRDDEQLAKSAWRDLAYMKTDWRGLAYDKGGLENTYMRQQLSISVGELIYGLGERFTPFVKNGQTVDIWNADGGTSTEQSYKNIPFYITNKGYGVFVNHPEKVSFEIGTENVTKVEFSVPGEYFDYFFINGPTMKDVLTRYTDLTGKPSLPAPWTFGLWLSTSFTTNYDEETVTDFVDGMISRGIPLRVFHFDCFWMREFCWSDFTWDNRVFPDPVGMLRRLKEKGLKICVWINPYIGQESILFKEGVEGGYFIKRPNGDVWQWDMWQPGMAIVDFTNPKACKWFSDKLEALLDMGVDCFKTDFGERIPTDVVYFDGSDPIKMHNYYTYLYNKTVYDLLEKKRGKGEAILFARSATVGGQKFPVHWGGDCWSDYESMEESLRGGLSLMMSGFGYWSHDIGGFEHTSTPDVYKRWAAFGLLSSHSRLHGSTSYRVPWVYDEEAVDVVRFFTKLKASLMPYLFKTAVETSKSGIPTMRSMVLEFTEDRNCHYLDKQYMLGDALLVSPIFNSNSMAEYYLPEGIWTNFFTGEKVEGSKWIKEKHSYLSIPLMVRENSIIAVGAHDDRADYDYGDGVQLRVYQLVEGKTAETVVYNMDGTKDLEASILKKDGKITVRVKAKKAYSICFVNETNIKASDAEIIYSGKDTVIKPKNGVLEIVCTIK
ncbi:alpha-xylosidase [Ruminiclostridium herbifermentans]|uniref:alpha-D-xyloside xylohydrolase n=1 Tax=Ruminiclostridium herbifermentans TaxID=2488810 RepID=A0A4U7JJH0_9FIRM|nr:alpha-xylosidase [Ruminiclostridium herbifermentans]QNU68449.1 alpha-xylosidase [Ruminiclostridium herbifermentans]